MTQRTIKPMVEGGILSAIAIIFAFMSAYLPVIGAFANLAWPVPIILLGVRHGYRASLMATIVSGILIALLMHPLHAVSVVVGFGLIGIVLGYAFRHEFSAAKAMAWGSAASLVSKAAVLAIGFFVVGVNPFNMQGDVMVQAFDEVVGIYQKLGMKEADIEQMRTMMKAMADIIPIILPAGFAMAAVVDTYLNFVLSKAVLKKLGHQVPGFPPFKEWTLPSGIAYALAVALVMLYWGKSREIELLTNVGMNLQVICTMLLVLQGLALFYFLADKYNLSRWTRGIILFLLLTNSFFTQLLMLSGVFDMLIDYRRLKKPGPLE